MAIKLIKKLNQLEWTDSFVQINTIKGFKYIDCAGEIVNIYHNASKPPQYLMDVNGLVFKKPNEKIEMLKVTPTSIWGKFTKPNSLDFVVDNFLLEAKKIIDVIQVDMASRIGWRNYFIYEFTNLEEQELFLKGLAGENLGSINFISSEMQISYNSKAQINIQPLYKINADGNNSYAVLFDIDLFEKSDFKLSELKKILINFKEYFVKEDGFLQFVNNTLKNI